MARERKPYFIPLAWASVAAGASADLTTAVRNATGRPFVITELGFNSTIDATTSTYAIFDLVFSTTTEEAFMPSAFRVNSVASMANSLEKIANYLCVCTFLVLYIVAKISYKRLVIIVYILVFLAILNHFIQHIN